MIEKGRSSREIAKSVGLAQSTINRVSKRLSTNVALSKGGHPKVLLEWERCYASWLVIVGGIETIIEAVKVLQGEIDVKMCDYLEECLERARIVFFHESCEACFELEEYQRDFNLLKCTKIGL